jgi:hypothetical protein
MELRQLRYFVGVGEEQHFGRAASLIWRKDNKSPLLQKFVAQVEAEKIRPRD